MKKRSAIILSALMLCLAFTGCGSAKEETTQTNETTQTTETTETSFDSSQEITVISREDGSGTRGAFTELFGIIEETEDGYQVSLDYIPNPDGKIIEDQILLEKKPKKAEILIEMTPYGLELYQGKTLVIVMPIVFWIVGLILLVIS